MRSFLIGFLSIALLFSGSSLKAQVCDISQLPMGLRNGLVAYYPFCGNANDVSGNGLNGIVNGATLTSDRFSIPNSAYSFNGSNYIRINNSPLINFGIGSYSLSCWVKCTGANRWQHFITHTESTSSPYNSKGYALRYDNSNPTFLVGNTFSNSAYETLAPPLVKSDWHNIISVVDVKTSMAKIYVDGIETFSGTIPNPFINVDNNGFLYLGVEDPIVTLPSGPQYFTGLLDDIMIFNRPISSCEASQIYNQSINSIPEQNFTVEAFQDTTLICGNNIALNAGSVYTTYTWNTGATTQTITPTSSGFYKVTVSNSNGCTATDSTYLSLVNATILQNDTTICLGSSLTLSIDSTSSVVSTACTSTQLPTNLQNGLVAYYPFCGNANDASGNSNNGIVNGAILTQDRFGRANSAYSFNGTSSFIEIPSLNNMEYKPITYSAWINTNTLFTSSQQVAGAIIGRDQSGNYSQGVLAFYSEKVSGIDNEIMYYTGDPQPLSTVSIAKYKINTNNWYHIVFTMELNGDWKFYVNGNLTNSGPLAVAQFKNLPFRIGASDGRFFWNGMLDDIAVWNRVLNDSEVKQLSSNVNSISWSNGATSKSITVSPTQSTKYYVTVSDGITTCTDSILVKVNNLSTFNPLPDTTRLCGVSAKLDAGINFSKYLWSKGETQQIIEPQIGGKYFVTVTDNLSCTASDSTYLSLVNANILQNDTTICNGGSITLSVDTVLKVINTFGTSLPTNLKSDLVAYYPFNGNANDESGNNNHATVYNARLTTDRFGRPNSAYAFSPTDKSSIIPGILNTSMLNSFTYSVWVKPLNTIVIPPQGQSPNAASGFPNNTCVIHPIHGQNYGPANLNTGTGVYVGTNGVYLEEHSAGWEAVPISHQMDLTGWHLINIVYENKIPTLYIDGVFIKKGIISPRQIFASLGPDRYPFLGPTASPSYNRSGIGAGYIPATGTTQYFNGDIDDIFFYRRALSSNEVTQIYNGALSVRWSTGDTTSRITVTPSATTKYFVTVSDGITTCTDSILVKVNNLSTFNPFPDTISQCGKSILLDAGGNFQTYNWNNGASTKSITVSQSGRYSIAVKSTDGCLATDSTVVSLVYVDIVNRDTTVCAPATIKLQITDTLVSKKGGWELLIPSSSFNFSETNFREGGFDPENAKLYSVLKNGSVNRFYVFDLNTNSVQTLESTSPPGEIYDYTYDFTNSRIIGTRVGRDRMFSIPLAGGTWTPFGNGNFDAESYGCATYWNPISRRPGFFGGYGFFSVKNWVWENNGTAGWQNVFANTSNCIPPKRTGQIARNKLGDKLFIFSGQGSCDGNQFASACSLSQPWATDVGVFCWLKDLWELDLNTYTFKNILPPNSPSVVNEGGFAYDYNGDVFYNVGGYKPLPTFSPGAASNLNYDVEVYRYRRGVDNGFELLPVDGAKPSIQKLSQYSGRTYFDPKYNRIIWARNDGIWALNLGASGSVSYKYKWSTGDSTTSITVNPTKTTTYYVSVTDGITTCSDSIKVTVEDPTKGIRYPTQDIIINRPTELTARKFGTTYLWNPDVQLNSPRLLNPIITPTKQQQYTVKITTDGGCVTVDTVLIRVFPDRNIYVPEGFTPDADGRNDRLYPIPVGIREMRTFRIYNRWGTLIFDNKNANINNGWDGTYLGTAQPMESYVWIAEGIDIDGKFIRRSGNTILIR